MTHVGLFGAPGFSEQWMDLQILLGLVLTAVKGEPTGWGLISVAASMVEDASSEPGGPDTLLLRNSGSTTQRPYPLWVLGNLNP